MEFRRVEVVVLRLASEVVSMAAAGVVPHISRHRIG